MNVRSKTIGTLCLVGAGMVSVPLVATADDSTAASPPARLGEDLYAYAAVTIGREATTHTPREYALGDLFIVEADGSGRHPLLVTPEVEIWPRWSPDRSRIAFVRLLQDCAGPAQVVIREFATGAETVATEVPGMVVLAAWSDDGTQVAVWPTDCSDALARYTEMVGNSRHPIPIVIDVTTGDTWYSENPHGFGCICEPPTAPDVGWWDPETFGDTLGYDQRGRPLVLFPTEAAADGGEGS